MGSKEAGQLIQHYFQQELSIHQAMRLAEILDSSGVGNGGFRRNNSLGASNSVKMSLAGIYFSIDELSACSRNRQLSLCSSVSVVLYIIVR
jgi:hypothetical protein